MLLCLFVVISPILVFLLWPSSIQCFPVHIDLETSSLLDCYYTSPPVFWVMGWSFSADASFSGPVLSHTADLDSIRQLDTSSIFSHTNFVPQRDRPCSSRNRPGLDLEVSLAALYD
ncbi:uncharacterized protein K444DRAFT_358236 [Hyaloscypha bicolor E]|uniref:Secreted protein n=1 Tax=Hyaloscypha bicolor E TaxID=1095630 RepID=A0A2J6TFV1_9HELO|nr:uncharacterized protein K444DRAFT_358236 [Hyaloscypha bicolor E]PMD61899.1 hypothetical protein K444DRAFT_358236 [Hyaloscypha bicolor E]